MSLYWTGWMTAFLLIWMVLKHSPELYAANGIWMPVLRGLSLLTILRTAFQMTTGQWHLANGFLPINPTFNAVWMASAACALLGASIHSRSDDKPGVILRLSHIDKVLIGGLIVLVAAGPSRITLLALAGGLLYVCRPWITLRRVAYGLILLLTTTIFIPDTVLQKRLRLNEGNYRQKIWAVAIQAVQMKPLTGWGPGTFELAYQRFSFPVETDRIRFGRSTQFAHNELLQVAATSGWPAFVLVCVGLWHLIRRLKTTNTPSERSAAGALVVLLIASCFTHAWHMPFLLLWTLISAGILFSSRSDPRPLPQRSFHLPVFASLVVVTAVTLGWTALPSYSQRVHTSAENVYDEERLARSLEQAEKWDLAEKHYRQALILAPNRALNAMAVGRLYLKREKWAEAIPWFEEARRIEPRYWQSYAGLALAWQHVKPSRSRWILQALDRNKTRAAQDQIRFGNDLPSQGDSSPYEQEILRFTPLPRS